MAFFISKIKHALEAGTRKGREDLIEILKPFRACSFFEGGIMARKRKLPKGVLEKPVNGTIYYQALIGGKYRSCGTGKEGYELAVAARAKEVVLVAEGKKRKVGVRPC